MLIVAVLPSILFPPKKTADRRTAGLADSTTQLPPAAPDSAAGPANPSARPPVRPSEGAPAETVWVTSPLYRLGFTTRGGALVRAELLGYRSFNKADAGRPVQLVREGAPLLVYRRTGGGADTTLVSDWILTPSAASLQVGSEGATLSFTGARDGARFALEYRFLPAEYRFTVRGRMEGFGPAGATTLVGLGDGLRSVEADSMDDFRHYALVTKATKTQRTDFGSVKPGDRKSLDDANPYGGFLQPIIQPVSVLVVNILIWMHDQLRLAYGWVLIIFGILVRLLLWPLNQRAMESSIRMQAVAPLLKQIQDRYKNEPERLQREMMKLYKEHNVNPFGGCLPMLLPMPVLFALFFVFANTIEFRGVPFLWLPDLARPDPYYIIPIVMGLSMFVLSKVGQIGVPPNPQTKMMLYFMPAFLTLLFLNFASGLNLYYAVSNIFSIPQQYLIAQRRLRDQGKGT